LSNKRTKLISLSLVVLLICSLGLVFLTSVSNASTGAYYSSKITATQGTLVSGSASSLSSKDASYLTINSVNSSGYTCLDWTAQFTISSGQVSSLGLSYSGKYSAFRGQYIYLYNYSTSAWQNVNYTNVGMAVVDINLPSIANPTNFVSPTGQVQVRLYSLSSSGYTSYTDCLKLCVAY
jgi:hypothetical protein